MKTFSFIVWQIKIPFYEIPVLGHSPFSIYKSTIRCYAEIILRLKVSSDPEEYKKLYYHDVEHQPETLPSSFASE